MDKNKGRKLETKWEGPYVVKRFGRSGVAAVLEDLHTGKVKGIYSLDSLKLYVPRREMEWKSQDTVEMR